MTKRQKLLQRFRTNPKTVRFDEIDNLLLGLGFEKRQVGSHATYRLNENIITIPFRKPYVLPVYVKNVISLLDALTVASGED
jgi:predicted RNA binding protein YcfA (HicA-like mRNA interferase family)